MHGTIHKKRPTGARNESLYDAARRLYDRANQSARHAEEAIILELRKRPTLQEEAFKTVAASLVNRIIAADRSKILAGLDTGYIPADIPEPANDEPANVTPIKLPSERSPAAIKASGEAYKRFVSVRLTGLYLAKFKFNDEEFLLGNATGDQLRPVAAHYMAQGSSMVRTGRFLERVIAATKDGQPVHKSITLKQLERMQKDSLESEV